jgi:tellurium resistance protein TerD
LWDDYPATIFVGIGQLARLFELVVARIEILYKTDTIGSSIMTINLEKGQQISLEKEAPNLEAGFIGLGWDVSDNKFDLDASAFLLNENDKLVSDSHFIFYNNPKSPDPDNSIEYMGDNRTGAGEGDDEVILVNLPKVPEDVRKIVVAVSIHKGDEKGQSFDTVKNAFVRLVNVKNKEEVVRYDLTEEHAGETAMIMAELSRQGESWQVHAVGSGCSGGLPALVERYSS